MSAEQASFAARAALLATLAPFVSDRRVLEALAAVAREHFVLARDIPHAYDNAPLAIGAGQTISQPLVVARMCELLSLAPGDRVLDVGTGSGYHAAVLSRLCLYVWSVERHASLSHRAEHNLRRAGIDNVSGCEIGDGNDGWPEHAPYDAISVAAPAPGEPPPALIAQLARGGRLIAPVRTGRAHRAERLSLHARLRRRAGVRWLTRCASCRSSAAPRRRRSTSRAPAAAGCQPVATRQLALAAGSGSSKRSTSTAPVSSNTRWIDSSPGHSTNW